VHWNRSRLTYKQSRATLGRLTHTLPPAPLPPATPPPSLQPQYDMATALIEAKQVMTGAVGELLAKTGEETQGVHTPADAIHTLLHTQLSGLNYRAHHPPPTPIAMHLSTCRCSPL
jgi:hypothetical protein